ncbi:mannose-6-phosphate isomerase-like protein (cupin superfamily) [Conyzicola lurida]|uniref:Mannose-6-phosphate isomerase-like protein (Cupin superfamily) n=1 Tax=Conyzicola lurida TaxID=1172621 RepID=A0A841AT05_9MICO|nr:cupin domain-containing protein [Conyzicola lurida]MBB5844715.1 mannose-6-phosphate isomerase-like protein (cupin superfamily) [Conyzicola lurida]
MKPPAAEVPQMRVQRGGDERRDVTFYGGAAGLSVERYFGASTALPAQVMLYSLAPGSSEGEHLHLEGHDESCSVTSDDELYVVVAGEVVMTVDGEREVLRAGDAAYAPAGSLHGVANESSEPARLVLVYGQPVPPTSRTTTSGK